MFFVLLISGMSSFFSGLQAHGQEVIDLSRQVQVEADDQGASKQALMDVAVEEASFESIKGLIGEEKTERSKDVIKNKIVKDSGKYVLSIKGRNFQKKGNVVAMEVDMKVSLKGLRALLLENGLLYQLEGPPKVLPVVQLVDRVGGRSYGWWYQSTGKDHAYVSSQLEYFHGSLRGELQKIGFYAMTPISANFAQSVPDSYRGENLQRADYLFLGEYFKSSIVVRGQILFRAKPESENTYLIDVRLEALHSGNGRLMGEVLRTYETDSGSYRVVVNKKFQEVAAKLAEDLSAQLSDAWKKGTFGASVVKLAVLGKMSPRELDEFKKTIVLQVRDIKSLRERLIEARKTTYEADSSALPQQLAQVIRGTKFAKYKVEVEEVSPEGLAIKVEAH